MNGAREGEDPARAPGFYYALFFNLEQ